MDPDETLRIMLEHAALLADDEDASEDAYRLADAVLALDEWITKGGFLPARWTR